MAVEAEPANVTVFVPRVVVTPAGVVAVIVITALPDTPLLNTEIEPTDELVIAAESELPATAPPELAVPLIPSEPAVPSIFAASVAPVYATLY